MLERRYRMGEVGKTFGDACACPAACDREYASCTVAVLPALIGQLPGFRVVTLRTPIRERVLS